MSGVGRKQRSGYRYSQISFGTCKRETIAIRILHLLEIRLQNVGVEFGIVEL
jgi:hypothetical protein